MKLLRLTIALLCLSGALLAQDLTVKDLMVEHKKNPVGIDITSPRFVPQHSPVAASGSRGQSLGRDRRRRFESGEAKGI